MKKFDAFKKWLAEFDEALKSNTDGKINDEEAIDEAFKSALYIDDSDIKSSKRIIMNAIDKNRYGKNPFKKIYFGLRKRIFSYTACAALIVAIIIGGPYLINLNKIAINNNETEFKVPQKAVYDTLHIPKTIFAAGLWETIDHIPDGLPWSIAYGGNNKLIFSSDSNSNNYLMSYNANSGKSGSRISGVYLDKIGASHTSGEVITMFEPSPDGDSTVIWNCDMNGGGSVGGINPNVYLYNFNNNMIREFKRGTATKLACAWSPSSKYFGFVNVDGGSILLYDSMKNTSIDIPFKDEKIKGFFVSDNGDITIVSDKSYMLSKSNNYEINELHIDGDILGYDHSGKIEYYSSGIIYRLSENTAKEVAKLGANFNLIRRYKLTGVYENYPAIFTDGKSTKVYNLTGTPSSFKFVYDVYKSPVFSPDLNMCLLTDSSKDGAISQTIVFQDGSTLKLPTESEGKMSNFVWFDNNSLAAIKYGIDTPETGDFVISRVTLK